MFLLKKIIGSLILPLPLCLLISFLGLFLIWRGRRGLTGKILVTIGLVSITFLSYYPVSRVLNDPLKGRFSAYRPSNTSIPATKGLEAVKYVVVLAGGHNADPSIPITGHLTCGSLFRLMEGIRVFRQHPGSKLVLSGCGAFDPVPESYVMADVARFLGIDKRDMILESRSNDTKDQARLIRPIVDKKPFVLVTSAIHMPRSMALFRKEGLNPIPAPAGQTGDVKQVLTPAWFFPSAHALEGSSRAVHEYLGLIWAKLRGQI
ncbi:MAG: envelope biogenesis factor ElyC [Deltaproteobacteria bacterium]|nr:envelope biogenesis factor ElyC [Deltaproteobacteria bacterium]